MYVPEATDDNATANMAAFADDLRTRGHIVHSVVRRARLDGLGRYGYAVRFDNGRTLEVEMPGLPIDRVRWLGPNQNIRQYPPLHVEGRTWAWFFALNQFLPHDDAAPSPNNTVTGDPGLTGTQQT